MRKRTSIVTRISLSVALATGILAFILGSLYIYSQKSTFEREIVREVMRNVESFMVSTLRYFYQQADFDHVQLHQRLLSQTENVLYSYIVKHDGLIDVGRSGLKSPDVGSFKQPWEPEIASHAFPGEKFQIDFFANEELATLFPHRISVGTKLYLLSVPLHCTAKLQQCAHIRVVILPESIVPLLQATTWTIIFYSILFIVCVASAAGIVSYFHLLPVRTISDQMNRITGAPTLQEISVEGLNPNPEDTEEIAGFKQALGRFMDLQALAARDAIIARLTTMLAHDVRAPFKMAEKAMSLLKTAEENGTTAEVLPQFVAEMQGLMERADALVQDVLVLGRTSHLAADSVQVSKLIQSALDCVLRLFSHTRHAICYEFVTNDHVYVDSEKLRRVVINLVTNALEAMPSEGYELWFKTQLSDRFKGQLEIVIGNTGSSIPTHEIPSLFEDFFSRRKPNGTGLGLAIAKKIVKDHGGDIWCVSSETSVEFRFTLPLACSEQQLEREGAPQPQGGASEQAPDIPEKRWIVVVDDNSIVRTLWSVSSLGSRVLTFEGPEAFWRQIHSGLLIPEEITCLVTDYFFGAQSSINGQQFLQKIKEHFEFPVFLSSDLSHLEKDAVCGFFGILDKGPEGIEVLRRRIEHVTCNSQNV
jgi:signal transduction histidine kinase